MKLHIVSPIESLRDMLSDEGYFLKLTSGGCPYITEPKCDAVITKNWPCGHIDYDRSEDGRLVICDTEGVQKLPEDFEDGQFCKIKTMNTTDENYEWLYSSDNGKKENL